MALTVEFSVVKCFGGDLFTEYEPVLENNILLCLFWHQQNSSTVQPFERGLSTLFSFEMCWFCDTTLADKLLYKVGQSC